MATITFQLSGSSVVNGSKSYTLSDADVQAWINYAVIALSERGKTPLTPTEALLAWVQRIWVDRTVSEVKQYATNQQIKDLNVPPIVFG